MARKRRPTSPRGSDKFAFSIAEKVIEGPLGRSSIYDAIKGGQLVVRKAGRRTIILQADWEAFLNALPNARLANTGASADDPADRRDGAAPIA